MFSESKLNNTSEDPLEELLPCFQQKQNFLPSSIATDLEGMSLFEDRKHQTTESLEQYAEVLALEMILNSNVVSTQKKHTYLETALLSNTTYSVVANFIFASQFISTDNTQIFTLTIAPVVAHALTGIFSIAYETLGLNDELKDESKSDDKNSNASKSGLARRFQSFTLSYQAVIAVSSLNY